MHAQNDSQAHSPAATWWRWGHPRDPACSASSRPGNTATSVAGHACASPLVPSWPAWAPLPLIGGSFSAKAAGWATLFLVAATAQLLFAAWELAIARSAYART